jgi:hypothetical protein
MPFGPPDAQWETAAGEMREILTECARRRCTITYGDLARSIGAARLEPRSQRFAALLGAACTFEDSEGRPMIGSLVVRKDTGISGAGYFRVARDLKHDVDDERAFWQTEVEKVYAYRNEEV